MDFAFFAIAFNLKKMIAKMKSGGFNSHLGCINIIFYLIERNGSHLRTFDKQKKNRSGTVSIVVAEKCSGIYMELITIDIAKNPEDINLLLSKGRNRLTKNKNGVIPVWIYLERNEVNVKRNCRMHNKYFHV